MKAKQKHNEFFGVLAFWEFGLMFALHDRGYKAGRIKQGMKADYHDIVDLMSVALKGTISKAIDNFSAGSN